MWPPASAEQPPNMHIGHPGTPTAQHPFAHHPFGAGAGCGCAAAHLFLLAHDRVVVIGARALSLPRSRTPCPQLKLAPPGTARTPKSCTATPLRPSTRAARCSIRRAQQHAWRGPTAASTACLASCMRSASRQVSDRPMITPPHRPLPAPSSVYPRASPRPAPRGLQPSRSLLWQARATLGTKGSPTIRKTTRCRVLAVHCCGTTGSFCVGGLAGRLVQSSRLCLVLSCKTVASYAVPRGDDRPADPSDALYPYARERLRKKFIVVFRSLSVGVCLIRSGAAGFPKKLQFATKKGKLDGGGGRAVCEN